MMTQAEREILDAQTAAYQAMSAAFTEAHNVTWGAYQRGERTARAAVYAEYEAARQTIRDNYAATLAAIPALPSAADSDELMEHAQ